ncbi:dihydrolipoyl dehydrogenase [Halopseudomonas salegens]|uniref:Dihydrolipoamide dehydrogenase n=1 Tax=Halopseudomonas salegens TaxID=1434072 RepID=A0A1H2HKL5_9GAMM|nr:dihydrolipoyl dehydrogenase [Halopseudomonas salegens]SDU32269.1 dihydrolipoamide dehydrogenase [Halopseudomonas salegens]
MPSTINVDVAIIGAGTAGMYALREVMRADKSFVLIDQGPLGTTCARVGCMPSKVALHAAQLWAGRKHMPAMGISGSENLLIDYRQTWQALRAQRDQFSNGAASKARKAAGDNLIMGKARMLSPTRISVATAAGEQLVEAQRSIVATGSRPVRPHWLPSAAQGVITSDELFELDDLPPRIGVIGLGAVGLEMSLALARLGIQVTAAGTGTLAGSADPDIAQAAELRFSKEFDLWLGEPAKLEPKGKGWVLHSGSRRAEVDLVVAALGRQANNDQLGLAEAGLPLDSKGQPVFDPQTLQVGQLPVFIAGDANGDRPLMHEAADEGAMAGFNACQPNPTAFRRKTPLAIAFSDPDLCTIGARYDQLDPEQILVGSAQGSSNGRARILGGEESLIRLYADKRSGTLLGASLLCTAGEHLAHQLAWAIQRNETALDLLQMPFYHPVIEEMLASALQEIAKHFAGTAQPLGIPLD